MSTSAIDPALQECSPQPGERRGAAKASTASAPAHPLAGMLWFAGWLFTVGFAKLVWWKVLLGLVVWPYFLGVFVR